MLKESLKYFLIPRASSFIIISTKNITKKMMFNISKTLDSSGSVGYLSKAKQIVLATMTPIIKPVNREDWHILNKILLIKDFLSEPN